MFLFVFNILAFHHFQMAAEQGNIVEAQLKLGLFYYQGDLLPF